MAQNTASITDITWDMLGDAGIDITKTERKSSGEGDPNYVYADQSAGIKIVFGPAYDVENNAPEDGDFGWDAQAYDLVDGGWNDTVYQHTTTAAEMVAWVAEYIKG